MSGHAVVHGAALVGLGAHPVQVECAAGPGLPGVRIIGLPDAAVREAVDRLRSAFSAAGLTWPGQRVVVNLAPADLPKAGSGFDLAIALAILAATGQAGAEQWRGWWAVGELGLDGRARPVPGALPAAQGAAAHGAVRLLVAEEDGAEASLVDGVAVTPVRDLAELAGLARGARRPRRSRPARVAEEAPVADLADVRGQPVARRAAEIAAAGGHHLLLVGPPGCGKTMLAHRLHGLLPRLSVAQSLEVAMVESVVGARGDARGVSLTPPLRAPHHTVTAAGLLGGGAGRPRPGELSRAHRGVLLLDELLEMPRAVLDALREPLERGEVRLTRARGSVRYPARALLVAATNPCPCGYLGHPRQACRCRPDRLERYRQRLSGPLHDRLDLQVELRPVDEAVMAGPADGEPTATVRERVAVARRRAEARWGPDVTCASAADGQVRRTARPGASRLLAEATQRLELSARGFDRCLRVARTIADLAGAELVGEEHVAEAVAYRLPAAVTA